VTAVVSTDITFDVKLLSAETGFNNQLQFVIQSGTITKGSYLRLGIPEEFQIYDAGIASSTCLKI